MMFEIISLVPNLIPDLVTLISEGKKIWNKGSLKREINRTLDTSSEGIDYSGDPNVKLIINKKNSRQICKYILSIDEKNPPEIIFQKISNSNLNENDKKRAIDESVRILKKVKEELYKNDKIFRIVNDEEFKKYIYSKLTAIDKKLVENNEILSSIESVITSNNSQHVRILSSGLDPVNNYVHRDEIEDLKKKVIERNNIFVHGQSGIGKSELCRSYIKQYRENNTDVDKCPIIWLNYENNLMNTVAGANGIKLSGLNDDAESIEKRYKTRFDLLCSMPGALVIIDNFNVSTDKYLGEFCNGNFKKIFITRNPRPNGQNPDVEIKPLSLEKQKEVFYSSMSEIGSPALADNEDTVFELINKSQGNTMLLVLFAKALECSNFDILGLLSDLKTGLKKVKERFRISRDKIYGKEGSIYEHVAALFDLSGWNETDMDVLRMLSLTPASGISKSIFERFTDLGSQTIHESLERISARGFIEYRFDEEEKKIIIMLHPMVTEVLVEELNPRYDNCKTYALSIFNFLSKNNYNDLKEKTYLLSIALYLCNSIENDQKLLFMWKKCISKVYLDSGRYSDALECLVEITDIMGNILPEDDRDIVEAYNVVGQIYDKIGNYDEALKYFTRTMKILEKVTSGDSPSLAGIYNNVASVYDKIGNYDEALKYFTKAMKILEKFPSRYDLSLAILYNNVGLLYSKMRDYDEALKYYGNSKNILEKTPSENLHVLAILYNGIGSVYDKKENYDEALKYCNKSLEIRKKILPKDHPDLAANYNDMGVIHNKVGNYDEALIDYEIGIEILKKLSKDHPNLAMLYGNVGITYKDMENYDEALKYEFMAADIIERSPSGNFHDLAITYDNIGHLYDKKRNYDKALKYHKMAVDTLESLSKNHPDLEIFYHNIGNTYDLIENPKDANTFYSKAKELHEISGK